MIIFSNYSSVCEKAYQASQNSEKMPEALLILLDKKFKTERHSVYSNVHQRKKNSDVGNWKQRTLGMFSLFFHD